VTGETPLAEEVVALPTPDHMSVLISSGGERGVP
jgi:hypothetical protein